MRMSIKVLPVFKNMLSSVLVLLLLSSPVALFAQEGALVPNAEEELVLGAPPELPMGVSCFDYYTFGSVQAQLTAETAGVVSGVPVTFSGSIINNNPYPIVDGSLFVKVFKSRGGANDGNGPDVVDEFIAVPDVVIPAKGQVPVSFDWNVPAYAASGEYRIATFFITSRKFNLLGLSFTDDVVGNSVPFSVNSERSSGVQFKKDSVLVAGDSYSFASVPPRVDKTAPVPVRATLQNTTKLSERVRVQWTVYQWDAQLRENVVEEYSQEVTIPAGGTAQTEISVTDTAYPVYLVRAQVTWKDTKSIIGVRFVREGLDRIRINFPGVLAYPLVAGQQNTLFSCVHNGGESSLVQGGSLELTLSDMDGTPIHTYTYTGGISGAMMGVADTFVPEKSYDQFVLSARLYQDGAFVDEAYLVYDCEKISPGLCAQKDISLATKFRGMLGAQEWLGATALGLLVLLFVFFILRRSSAKETHEGI